MSNDAIEPRPADSGDVVPSVSDLVDVNVIELRLPCRSFRIRYKVAEPGEFSMTTEFLLRLLRLVNALPETTIGEFFGFTNDETRFIVDHVENQGYVRRSKGRVHLTDAGHGLFSESEEPALFEVSNKEERFDFDLISLAPSDQFRIFDDFEYRLPELSIEPMETGEQASAVVMRAFKRFFQEFRLKRGGTRLEKQSLYTVDFVNAEQRFSTLVPVTVSVRKDDPEFPEASVLEWRSGTELDDRSGIVQKCAEFVRSIQWRADQFAPSAISTCTRIAPSQLAGMVKDNHLNAEAFFKATLRQAGELRVDRQTVRVVGQLWTDPNRARFASALKYAIARSSSRPKMQFWLKPSIPHWGATRRVAGILGAVEKQLAETPDGAIRSILAGEGRVSRFKTRFNGILTFPNSSLPSGLEIFLVPSHVVYVAVHSPLKHAEGYPVPIGIISFDSEVLSRAQAALFDILRVPGVSAHHCDWNAADMVVEAQAVLAPVVADTSEENTVE
jgi:hypothetical protein